MDHRGRCLGNGPELSSEEVWQPGTIGGSVAWRLVVKANRQYNVAELLELLPRRFQMIHPRPRRSVQTLTATILVAVFANSPSLLAQSPDYLVSPSDMQKAVVEASQKRLQNRETLQKIFSSEKAQKALMSANMSPQQVEVSITTLSDAELAQLASRATKAQNDFAAGSMSDRDLLLILVAIAALILIIVAVR